MPSRLSTPKHPPYSIEAEQSVLGGLMLDNRRWYDLAGRLTDSDFYCEDHQLIFRSIAALIGASRPCDFVTLSEHLENAGKLDAAGGRAYLGWLANDTPSAANLLAHADIVRECSILRQLIAAGSDNAEMGSRPEGRKPAELIDEAERSVLGIRERGARGQAPYYAIGDVLPQVEERIDELRMHMDQLASLDTGINGLDKITHGLHPGDLVIVAGRPAMGKTSFALNIAEHVAVERQQPVAVFSMEMSAEQLALRLLSSFGRIDRHKLLRSGALTDGDWSRLSSAACLLREAPLYIDETGALNPLELRARARRLAARHGLALVVVDDIQLMQLASTRENRTNEISEISRSLKVLARDLAVPVVAISQLSRAVEARDNKRPRMSDLRESGSIEPDADLVLFVYRDEYYNPETADRGIAEIIVAKQRNGPTGVIKTAFLGQYARFDNLAPDPYN